MCDEECWDDADAPPYIPNVENRKIIKVTPPRMTKAQKKPSTRRKKKRKKLGGKGYARKKRKRNRRTTKNSEKGQLSKQKLMRQP